MIEKILNCYDSHVHFWATGQVDGGLKLQGLKSAADIKNLQINSNHYRSGWISGFGWDQNNWLDKKFPHKSILDEVFKDTPVFFSRVDGHASWINTAAIAELKRMGFNFSDNPLANESSGILLDQAHINALLKLPDYTDQQNKIFFENAQKIFNKAGFTHIRDMSMNLPYWKILCDMEDKKNLTLCVDAFVTVENIQDLDRVIQEISQIGKQPSKQMRLHGVKIFIDGSLGSKTAFLSKNYLNSQSNGVLLWKLEEITELIRKCWQAKLEVAVHCIGDEASQTAALAAREVSAQGILGRLHLEHVQILRQETLQILKPLHVTCYLQPCHWLSDYKWLPEVIDRSLLKSLFPWEALRKMKIPFYFGSDSPIEKPSLMSTVTALQKSPQFSVPELKADWKLYHSHPDKNWCSSWTVLENNVVKEVVFNGRTLLN